MWRDNPKLIVGFMAVILLVGFYAFPLLWNVSNSFTLYPKNIPNFYSNYSTIFTFKESVLESMRFPLWYPFCNGGKFVLTHPTEFSSSIFSALALLMGEVGSVNLSWFLAYILGACSMFYLMRCVLKCSLFGAIFSALVFSMSGLFAYLFENGIFYCKELLFLPLLLAFFIKAKNNLKFIILCSFVSTLLFFQTALFFPIIILFISLFAVSFGVKGDAQAKNLDLTHLRNLMLLGILTLFLSAVKLIPMVTLISTNNRLSGLSYADAIQHANTLELFIQRMFVPVHLGPGTMYIGFLPVILGVCAPIFLKETRRFFILLLIFVALSFGPNSSIDLHRLLWNLPIFNSIIEIAKYYAVIIVFLVAILSGEFFTILERSKKKVISVAVPAILLLFVFFDLLNANTGYFNAFDTKLDFKKTVKNNFHIGSFNVHSGDESILSSLEYFLGKKNVGLINPTVILADNVAVIPKFFLIPQYAFLSPYTSLLVLESPDYKGEVFFLNAENVAELLEISPDLIVVRVKTVRADRLVINQNFDRSWTTNLGELENYHGLISIRFDAPSEGLIRLKYVPKMFYLGLTLSLVSFLCACYLLARKRK